MEQELALYGYGLFQTVGDSMEPLLHNRISTVLIEIPKSPLKKYDVALYRRPRGEYVLHRVVKVLDTADVAFMGLQAAKLSGSGIGIGLQSKGTTVIHQKDLYPLTTLELFPQAPLMPLYTYRKVGRNAAKYVKGEQVTPIEVTNDPMVRAKYQVKAALMHIIEMEQLSPEMGMIEWEGKR